MEFPNGQDSELSEAIASIKDVSIEQLLSDIIISVIQNIDI